MKGSISLEPYVQFQSLFYYIIMISNLWKNITARQYAHSWYLNYNASSSVLALTNRCDFERLTCQFKFRASILSHFGHVVIFIEQSKWKTVKHFLHCMIESSSKGNITWSCLQISHMKPLPLHKIHLRMWPRENLTVEAKRLTSRPEWTSSRSRMEYMSISSYKCCLGQSSLVNAALKMIFFEIKIFELFFL